MRRQQTEHDSSSRLPQLPPKAKVKSDHLSFREPGYVFAAERFRRLDAKIKLLRTEEEELKNSQEELGNKCRKEVDEVRRWQRQLEGFSGDAKFQVLFMEAWQLIGDIGDALLKTISSDDSEGQQRQKSVRLNEVRRKLERKREKTEMENRTLQSCDRALSKLQNDWENIDKESPQKDQPNGSHREVDEDQEDRDSCNGSSNRSETDGEVDEGPANGTKRKKVNEKDIEKNRMKIKKWGVEQRRKGLESEIKEKEQEREACRSRYEDGLRKLRSYKDRLKEKQQKQQGKHKKTDDDEDRQQREDQQIAEWSKQQRKEQLRTIQNQLRRMNHRRAYLGLRKAATTELGSDESEIDDELEESNEQNHSRQLGKALHDARALEDLITKVRSLIDKVDRKRDLRIVLEWERFHENKWLKQVGQRTTEASLSMGEKDHLAGNSLQDFKVYRQLGPGEVRIVLLMPSPKGCADYPLICALATQSWTNGALPEYAALSYHWGPDSENGRLYLVRDSLPEILDEADWGFTARRAIRIPIRDNLFRALLRLRRRDSPVALWVDYLCIDQSNKQEKTEQLANMVNVYKNAKNVCIWLGEGDAQGRSNTAMRFIPNIMDFAVLYRYAMDKQHADSWYALAELMRDRWFSRLWVVQEISLAQSATVHCGDKTVHWSDFADAVSLLASNQGTIKKLFDYSTWREGPNTLGDVQSFGAYILLEATSKLFLRDATGGIREPLTNIESLVTSLTTFDTSDRRDLIYSLVSIARDTSRKSGIYSKTGAIEWPLDVNYKSTPIEVYKDFTKFCIQSSYSLDIICHSWAMPVTPKSKKPNNEDGGTADQEEGMPSWIPLLSDSEYGAPAEVYSGRKNGVSLVGPAGQQPRYAASGKRRWNSREPLTRAGKYYARSIFLTGIKMAKIEVVSARNTGGVILHESLTMGSWTGIQNRDSVPDKIWRTLVADRDSDGQIAPTWYQRACMRCLEIADTFNNGDLNVGELLQEHSEMLRKYLTRVRNVTWNRVFFNATIIEESEDKDGLEKQTSSGGAAETAAEGDRANRSRDGLQTIEEHGASEETSDNSEGDEALGEVPAVNGAERVRERPAAHETESQVDEVLDENETLDSQESSGNGAKTWDDDGLFGLGPPRCQKGDFVCILFGCSVPVILRQTSPGHYMLVGEAYVHGKMDGEALTGRHRRPGNKEVFELR